MAERAPPPADPPGPQFMAEKLARLDADLHRLLDAAAPMREDCAARDPRAPAEGAICIALRGNRAAA